MEGEQKSTVNSYQNQRLDKFEKHLESVDGHIATINGELESVKTDMSWVKKFLWIIITGLIGMMIALIKIAFL